MTTQNSKLKKVTTKKEIEDLPIILELPEFLIKELKARHTEKQRIIKEVNQIILEIDQHDLNMCRSFIAGKGENPDDYNFHIDETGQAIILNAKKVEDEKG